MSSGGGQQYQQSWGNTQSNQTLDYGQPMNDYTKAILNKGESLMNNAFPAYTGTPFAPTQPGLTQSWQNLSDLTTGYQPYMNTAGSIYGSSNPQAGAQAGSPYLNAAFSSPSGFSAGSPYFNAATSTTWPQAASSYMNPYIGNALSLGNQLATQNFVQNTLPGLNSQFVASGGGLGNQNSAYNNAMNWALTNFNNSLNLSNANALSNEYNQGANQFFNQQGLFNSVGANAGNLANASQSTYGNLGNIAGALANAGFNNTLNLGNAISNLGQTSTNLGLATNQALNTAGQQQQQIAQNPYTFNYQQFEQGAQWPYQLASWAANLQSPLHIGYNVTGNSSSNSGTTTTQSGSGSPLGSILGGLATIGSLAIPGAGGASALGNLFGSLSGPTMGGITQAASAGAQAHLKKGGYMRRLYARGGTAFPEIVAPKGVFDMSHRGHYSTGGYAPTVRAQAQNVEGEIEGARKKIAAMAKATGNASLPYKKGGFTRVRRGADGVPEAGLGGMLGSLVGGLFGGSGKEIGGDIGTGIETLLPLLMMRKGGFTRRYAAGGIHPTDMVSVQRRLAPDQMVDYGSLYPVAPAANDASVLRDSPLMRHQISSALDSSGMMTPGGMTTQMLDRGNALDRARTMALINSQQQQPRRRGGFLRGYADGGGARRIPTTFDVRDPTSLDAAPSMPHVSPRETIRNWKDFMRQFPIGVSHGIADMVGFPGSIYDLVSDNDTPSALSGEHLGRLVDEGFDRLYGGTSYPESAGGDAGRIAGALSLFAGRAAPKAATVLGRLAQRGLTGLNVSAVPDVIGEKFPTATDATTEYLNDDGYPSLYFGTRRRGGFMRRAA